MKEWEGVIELPHLQEESHLVAYVESGGSIEKSVFTLQQAVKGAADLIAGVGHQVSVRQGDRLVTPESATGSTPAA